MKIIKEALLPYKKLFADLKNTISAGLFIYFLAYSGFVFYCMGVVGRIAGSGNADFVFMIKIITIVQEIPVLCIILFYLKKINIRIIKKEKGDIFVKDIDSLREGVKNLKYFFFLWL